MYSYICSIYYLRGEGVPAEGEEEQGVYDSHGAQQWSDVMWNEDWKSGRTVYSHPRQTTPRTLHPYSRRVGPGIAVV